MIGEAQSALHPYLSRRHQEDRVSVPKASLTRGRGLCFSFELPILDSGYALSPLLAILSGYTGTIQLRLSGPAEHLHSTSLEFRKDDIMQHGCVDHLKEICFQLSDSHQMRLEKYLPASCHGP